MRGERENRICFSCEIITVRKQMVPIQSYSWNPLLSWLYYCLSLHFCLESSTINTISSPFLFCIWLKCHLPFYCVVPRIIPYYLPWFWSLRASSSCYSNLLLHCWLALSALGSPGDRNEVIWCLLKE